MSYYYYTQVGCPNSFSGIQFGPRHRPPAIRISGRGWRMYKTLTEAEQEWLYSPALAFCFPPHPMERLNIHIISVASNHG